MLNCKGLCTRLCLETYNTHEPRYQNGHKRCTICEVWYDDPKLTKCPCCKVKLRTKSRNEKKKVAISE